MLDSNNEYTQPEFLDCTILINQDNGEKVEIKTNPLFDIKKMCISFNQNFPNKHIHLIKCICLVQPNYVYELYDTNKRYVNKDEIFIEREKIYNIPILEKSESNKGFYKK